MKRVSFPKAIELFSGRIGLTDAQASVRVQSLKPVGDGIYEITSKVEFKAGEMIELESFPKGLAKPEAEAIQAEDKDPKAKLAKKVKANKK